MPAGRIKRLRVIGALRKSVVPRDKRRLESDPLAYSLEDQRGKLTTALGSDHDLVDFAEDEGVKGDATPFRRPHLGPWFKRLDEWDAIAVARFDRISRSVAHFSDLCEWLREHGKVLICLDPPIDLSTPHGVAFAQMLAVFAQYERALIKLRVADKWHELRDAGKWMGGPVPFGRMPVDLGREGWALMPDPQYQPAIFGMASQYVAGSSHQMIADWLNAEKVLTSKDAQRTREAARRGEEPQLEGTKWTKEAVAQVLRNPGLGGFVPANGDLRRDADGMLIKINPLIPEELYQKLRAALDDRSYRRKNASKLRGVAFCLMCGRPLHSMATSDDGSGHVYRYYGCWGLRTGECHTARIPADYLEQTAAERFLEVTGDQYIREPVYIAGTDASAELAAVQEAIDNLEAEYVAGRMTGPDGGARFTRMMSRLEERQANLAAVRTIPARTDYRETEVTFRQRWEKLDDLGRRMLMADSGFRVYCAWVPVPAEEIADQARRIGVTSTTRQLTARATTLNGMIRRSPQSPRTAEWQAQLAEVEDQRTRLREIPRLRKALAAPTGQRLAQRAGLASAGQVAATDSEEEDWEAVLATIRRSVALRPVK